MFRLIAIPLGLLMELCYKLIKDYGLALLVFTILIKIILLPLQIKQQKSTAKMQRYQPEIEKIRKKYGKNNEQMQQKLAEFYAKEGVSPAGSCLPMIISMLVLFSLINVVYQPIYYVLNDIDNGKIDRASNIVSSLYTVCYDIKDNEIDFEKLVAMYDADNNSELSDEEKDTMINALNENKVTDKEGKEYNFKSTSSIKEAEIDDKKYSAKEQITKAVEALMMYRDESNSLYSYMIDESKVSKQLRARPELVVINIIKDGYTQPFEKIDSKLVSEVEDFNYTLLGFGLGVYPSVKNITILIPIISFVTQLVCTFVSNYFTKKNNPSVQMGGGMKMMMYVMPLFSLFIAFGFPAGLGIYWIYSGIFSLLQIIVLNIVYTPERIGRMVDKEMASNKHKKRKTMMQRMLEMQNADGTTAEVAKRLNYNNSDNDDDENGEEEPVNKKELSKAELKELQRKKLNEARKRMAEKYGDEYYED